MNRTHCAALLATPVAAALLLSGLVAKGAAPPTPQGAISAKEFLDIGGGTTIPDLTNNVKFPNNPDVINYPIVFEWPAELDGSQPPGDVRNSYGVQIIGYFYPTTTGLHTFYLAADDNALLYLSTDENPANKHLIALETAWSTVRQFDASAGASDLTAKRSDEYAGSGWPGGGAAINLTAGKPYYIEALMKEGGGGDNLAVSLDAVSPIPGAQLSTIDKVTGAVSIKTQPQSQTVQEGTPVSFSVVPDGTPPYAYQWKKGGTDITDATNFNYSIQFTSASDAGSYTVAVTGGQGSPATSSAAVLTVTPDTTPPTVLVASGGSDFKHVTVVYSERVDATTAANKSNYAINSGITVSDAALQNDTTVILTTSLQALATPYTLTINNVKDRAAAPNTLAANTVAPFGSAVFKTGIANWRRFLAVDGDTGDIDAFAAAVDDPTTPFRAPDAVGVLGYLGSPRGVADNYGCTADCYFVPPTTGQYVFFFSDDDHGYLYLSTDENPANKKKIAAQPAWADMNQWIDPDTEQTRSDKFDASEWTPPNVINLTAGKRYYLEIIFQEGGGGDGSEATYKLASDPDPANGTASKLTGSVIGSYVDPAVLVPVITNRPSGVVFAKGDTLTLTVGVDSAKPVTYQWYQNKIAVPGATSSSLVIANADHNAVGDYYVDVSNSNGTTSSFPDDSARAIMKGAFLIEAEDFNFNKGQTKPEASVMPYLGNVYTNITTQVNDIDFFNTADESAGAAVSYSRFTADQDAVVDMKGPADPADYLRGDFTVTANYAVGWTDKGEWQNYTRTFPDGDYVIIGGLAYDGRAAAQLDQYVSLVANPAVADGSQPGVEGGQQGLTKLGVFKAAATGAWSSNDLIPLRDDAGAIAKVHLSGAKTLRWTANKPDGDQDYLLLYNVGGGGAPGLKITSIALANGQVVITYPSGTLQNANSVTGTWTDVAGATSPYSTAASGAEQYFRLKQ